jgi:guanylate kinase
MLPNHTYRPGGALAESKVGDGLLFILVGPSGVGKNTLMRAVIDAIPDLRQMPTATTRPPRVDETEGLQHFFVSSEEFRQMIALGELFEYQEVDPGKFYGIPRRPLERALRDHHELLMADIDMHGAEAVKAAFPERAIQIFVAPPSMKVLEDRLRKRGNISEAELEQRLERAKREMLYAEKCEYRVINDELGVAIHETLGLVEQALAQHGWR